jgi:TetR/AcrR family transcriptional regulator, regulator of autoinduction and epiphytic fitness
VSKAPTLSDRKREAILHAAADNFREEGFHATTMDRVAERAAVSKRTVYNHFPSKDILFDVVIDQAWAQLMPRSEPLPPSTIALDERLRIFGRRRVDTLLAPQLVGLIRVVLGESVRTPELARAYMGLRDQRSHLGLRALFTEEIERGRLRIEQLDLAASQYWGLLLGPLFWPRVLGMRSSPDDTERELVVNEAVALFLSRYGVTKGRKK